MHVSEVGVEQGVWGFECTMRESQNPIRHYRLHPPSLLLPPFKTVLWEIKMKIQRLDLVFSFCLCQYTIKV